MKSNVKNLVISQILESFDDLDTNSVQTYIEENYPQSLNEMARVNKKEFTGYFPYNKFDIRIWSNDHNPPHFHVIADGWDIVVEIETGEILKIKTVGKSSKIYTYIKSVVKDWLKEKSAYNKKLTNKEAAQMYWDGNN